MGRPTTTGPERSGTDRTGTKLSRRSLFTGIPVALAIAGLGQSLSGCSWGPEVVPAPTPEPVETPGTIPDPPDTPAPIPTPDPVSTPDPDPTPTLDPVEQVVRVARTFLAAGITNVSTLPDCLNNDMTTAGLVRLNEDFLVETDWAIAWERLEDRDGWRFRLRLNQNVWDDEFPLTAHDFVAAWRSLLNPETRSPHARLLYDIENAEEFVQGEVSADDLGIVAVNDFTLEVYLTRQRESFPVLAASTPMVPISGPSDGSDAERCWISGAFRPEQRDEETISLVRNERYWDSDSIRLDRVEFTAQAPNVALNQFRQSELDLMLLTGTDVTRVREDSLLNDLVMTGMPERIIMLIPDVEVPPFDSVEVRRALSAVIDRRRLEQIVEGRVIPATRLFPAGMFLDLDDASGGLQARFDVDAAYAEIAETPYSDPEAWEPFGLDVPSGDTYLDRVARDVVLQIRENLGVQVPIRFHDPEEYAEGLLERRFPLAWVDWTYQYADPACGYADLFGGWRTLDGPVGWSDPGYDELVRAADTLLTVEERASAYAGCEGLLQEHGAYIPLVHPVNYYLVQPWLDDLPVDTRGRLMASATFGVGLARTVRVREWPE